MPSGEVLGVYQRYDFVERYGSRDKRNAARRQRTLQMTGRTLRRLRNYLDVQCVIVQLQTNPGRSAETAFMASLSLKWTR